MSFKKYNVKNDAFSQLLVGISAGATTIELKASEWERFPTGNFIWTLVEYAVSWDPTSEIIKKEKVLVTGRDNDTLTVTRWFGWDTPTSFAWDDFFYLNVTAEVITDIQDECTRIVWTDIAWLQTNKLNRNNQLRTWNGAWRISYNNGSWNEVELPLWTNWFVLQSNWPTSAPSFVSPTVNIPWLDEDTVWDMEADEFVKNDWSWNKRILMSRYRATDLEAETWTETKKFITPKQVKDNYNVVQNKWNQTINATRTATTAWTNTSSSITTDFICLANINLTLWSNFWDSFARLEELVAGDWIVVFERLNAWTTNFQFMLKPWTYRCSVRLWGSVSPAPTQSATLTYQQ